MQAYVFCIFFSKILQDICCRKTYDLISMEFPRLIEQGTQHYLQHTLSVCHENRVRIYSIALNVTVFLLFVSIVSAALYICYKRKPTPYEANQKMLRDQEIILSKIRYYQAEQKNLMMSPIGTVPCM